MSQLDKQLFLRDLESRLGNFVPANILPQILVEAGETLVDYDLESHPDDGEDGSSSRELVKLYSDAKRAGGRAESTIARYEYVLHRLLDDVGVPFSRMTVYHIRAYNTSEKKRGIKASTLEGNRSIYADFFRWLKAEGMIQIDPMEHMPIIRTPKIKRKPFSTVEIKKLERAATNKRDRAIIEFLHATGCRVSEVVALNRDDIDIHGKRLTVFGKGAKERTVYLTDAAAFFLKEYLDSRTDSSPALFPSRKSDRMTDDGVRAMLKALGQRAGVDHVHPHRFRRTLATELTSTGMPIQEAAAILGHERLETTMLYACIDQTNVEASYRKYA